MKKVNDYQMNSAYLQNSKGYIKKSCISTIQFF